MEDPTEFQSATINGVRLVARRVVLEALTRAHEELVRLGVGADGKLGFIPGPERTSSWRSEVLQRQLLSSGASKTMYSNHRSGTAVDCLPDWGYIGRIRPTMNKYGLVNDLAYITGFDPMTGRTKTGRPVETDDDQFSGSVPWDGGHWNWKSNSFARSFPIANSLPALIREFSMQEYDNHVLQLAESGVDGSGSFALVYGEKKHPVTKDRMSLAVMTALMRGMVPAPVNKKTWDSIPTGDNF